MYERFSLADAAEYLGDQAYAFSEALRNRTPDEQDLEEMKYLQLELQNKINDYYAEG